MRPWIGHCHGCRREDRDVQTRYDRGARTLCDECYGRSRDTNSRVGGHVANGPPEPPLSASQPLAVAEPPSGVRDATNTTPFPTSGVGRVSGKSPVGGSSRSGPDRKQAAGLLTEYRLGKLAPITIDMGTRRPGYVADTAAFLTLLFGLQRAAGESWPLVIGCKWAAGHIGRDKTLVAAALRRLCEEGYLEYRPPARPARRYVLGPRAQLGVGAEPGGALALPESTGDVETPAGVRRPAHAAQPQAEAMDEIGVGDAVGRRPAGDLHWLGASAGDAARAAGQVVGVAEHMAQRIPELVAAERTRSAVLGWEATR